MCSARSQGPIPGGVAIITGGGRGIGAATAALLAGRGYRVAVSFLQDGAAAESLVARIQTMGGLAIALRGDVSLESDVISLFDETERAFGPVTALVSNAGITGQIGPLHQLPAPLLQRVVDVNLVGCVLCNREAVRRMSMSMGGKGGAIVNVSSVAANTGSPGEYVHYAATKAGVEAFTIGLAREVAVEGIRVNAVSPGTTRTGIHAAGGDPDRASRVAGRIPMGRVAEPEEIAEAIAWLLSPAAAYASGTILKVSGGL